MPVAKPNPAQTGPYPPPAKNMAELKKQAKQCRACDLWRNATQTVMGEGKLSATIMLVGEQPGDKEDLAGRPFVGPAGALLDSALDAAGIDRSAVYVTNAVRHFKYVPRGKRRMHQRPNAGEVQVCRWWMQQELKFVRPRVVVAMGRTAAYSLLGRAVTIAALRGTFSPLGDGGEVLVTVHPSSLLRAPDEAERKKGLKLFIADLKLAGQRAIAA